MNLFKRIEKKIAKLERNIERKQKQIEKLRIEWKKHRVTVYYFISQRERIEEKINAMMLKVRVLKDEMVKKKRKAKNGKKERKIILNGIKNMKILKIKEVK